MNGGPGNRKQKTSNMTRRILLTALVALAYLLSYVLLQMETYAFLVGTLVLFVLLVGIMYLTRNLNSTPSVAE